MDTDHRQMNAHPITRPGHLPPGLLLLCGALLCPASNNALLMPWMVCVAVGRMSLANTAHGMNPLPCVGGMEGSVLLAGVCVCVRVLGNDYEVLVFQ